MSDEPDKIKWMDLSFNPGSPGAVYMRNAVQFTPIPACEDCQQNNHMHLMWLDYEAPEGARVQAELIIPKGVRIEFIKKTVQDEGPEWDYLDLHMTWLEGSDPNGS